MTLETASRTIREAYAEGSVPDAVAAAITEAYRNQPGSSVAVRSSATAEEARS